MRDRTYPLTLAILFMVIILAMGLVNMINHPVLGDFNMHEVDV